MQQPSADQLLAIVEGLERLQEVESLDGLGVVLVDVVSRVVEADHACYNELDPGLERGISRYNEPSLQAQIDRYMPAFVATMHQHPVLNYYLEHAGGPPQRLSDFMAPTALHDTGLYQEVFRPMETEHQGILHVAIPGRAVIGVALNRRRPDFGERDLTALALLQPGVQRIYDACRRRALVTAFLGGELTPVLFDALIAFGLTEREAEICFWIAQGKSNGDIGTLLGISPLTAKKHSENIYRKLGAPGRIEAVKRVLARLMAEG